MGAGSGLPSGTVTFLFTDIERSTESAAALGDERWADLLQVHRDLLRPCFASHNGVEVSTEGDAFFVAFSRASDAVGASIAAQRALEAHEWAGETRLRVRMGLHTGEALVRSGDYVGHEVHKAKRVCDAGHGGQVLLSQSTADVVGGAVDVRNLGSHRLKDLGEPQPIYQVVAEGLQERFPRLRSLEALNHNLPVQLTSFIGRERELDEARRLLASTRLLTITGAGGSGKTRLALQLLAEILPETPGGVWLADLAPLTDASLVAETVAEVISAPSAHIDAAATSTKRTPLDRLVEHFAGRNAALLLDNCEHVLGPCAELAAALLRECRELRIVVTTREPLGLAGETSWRLPSLTVPEDDPTADDLLAFESTRLFCERAGQADAGFRPTSGEARAIAEICARLDGIPLAIELAAARTRVLAPTEIAKRLDDMFRLLTGGSRTALPRQQTLRATVDWSYELLDSAQRALLMRLSVFAGGWTLEAAETISADKEDVLEVLGALVDRSLVVRLQREGTTRYRLLDTIRHYAREKLVNSGEGAELRRRHMAYFAGVMEQFKSAVRGPESAHWMDVLDAELDNLRAAFDWALTEDPLAALRMTDSWWYFGCRGNWPELHRWITAALAATPDAPSPERSAGLRALAVASVWTGDSEKFTETLEASLAMSRGLDDQHGTSWALTLLSMFEAVFRGVSERALDYANQGLDHARTFGIDILEADAKFAIAMADPALDTDARLALYEECAAIYDRVGDYDNEANAHRWIGDVARERRDFAETTRRYELALEFSRRAGCHGCAAIGELGLAGLSLGGGDVEAAAELCRGPLRYFGRTREVLLLGIALGTAARIANETGDASSAAKLLGACDAVVRPSGFWAVSEGRLNRLVARVRLNLDDDAFSESFAAGTTMSVDEAVSLALELLDHV